MDLKVKLMMSTDPLCSKVKMFLKRYYFTKCFRNNLQNFKEGVKSSTSLLSVLPPGEYEFVEVVVTPGQDAPLHDVRLHAHRVAPTLNVRPDTVQQVSDGGDGLPGSERHHRFLVRLQVVDGVVIETQVLLRSQYADHDGGVAGGDGFCSGDADQHLEVKSK